MISGLSSVAARWTSAIGIASLLFAADVAAQARPPVRLTESTAGDQGNRASRFLGLSRDTRHLLFRSLAANLVAGDSNGVEDLFVRDRDTDRDGVLDEPGAVATVRVSVGTAGEQSNRDTVTGGISADGRFVWFSTEGAVTPGDTNGVRDVFVRDRDTDADGIFDEPGAVATVRVSEGSGGQQGDGASQGVMLTPDGRYALFMSQAPAFSPIPIGGIAQIYRKDRVTGQLTLVSAQPAGAPANGVSTEARISDDGRIVSFRSEAFNLGPGGATNIVVRDLVADTIALLPPRPAPQQSDVVKIGAPLLATNLKAYPGVTPDGQSVYYGIETIAALPPYVGVSGMLFEYVLATGAVRQIGPGIGKGFASDSRYVLFETSTSSFGSCALLSGGLQRYDRVTGVTTVLTPYRYTSASVSGSMERILMTRVTPEECVVPPFPPPTSSTSLLDRRYDAPVTLAASVGVGALNHTGSETVFESDQGLLPGGVDTNAAADVFALDLDSQLDQDSDGLDDRWEAATGLSYTSAAGADGPSGDPDGDGVSNLAEQITGSHPRGTSARYLAEGAENSFFRTRVALANPGASAATAVVRLLSEGGGSTPAFISLPAMSRRTLDIADVPGRAADSFSSVIESDAPIVVDRTMTWDATGYGAHAEHAVDAPSTTWFLAEGSTTGTFSLFYLLQNPNPETASATVRYLLPSGPPIEKTYTLSPGSRTTIPVNLQAPALASTDVSAAITADRPILVERAMYFTRDGQPFAAGHDSAGVTAAATSWFLAEGATGAFFDMFILIANPSATAAEVEARYLLPSGDVIAKTYTVAANSRRTIWVDGEEFYRGNRPLASVNLSTTLTSLNGVPIVVERTMWFPGPEISSSFWTEAHNAAGATAAAPRWVLADGEDGGPGHTKTYILIANPSNFDARVRITALVEHSAPRTLTVTVPVHSRHTVDAGAELFLTGLRFATIVESIAEDTYTVVPIVVERAMYWDAAGVVWAAGTNVLGTAIP